MATARTKADLLAQIEADRAEWRALLAEVGEGRMEQPGPMGEWTFKDLAAHLTGWRERSIARLEAAGRHQETPAPPWPANLNEDDEINTGSTSRTATGRSAMSWPTPTGHTSA